MDPSANFCPFCGQKRGSNIVNTNETNKNAATKCLSFKNYAAKKTEERSTHFRSGSKKKAAKSKNVDPFALINIGIMRYVSPDVVTPVRGKTLPLKVKKDSEYIEVFAEALVKRQAHDKSFDTTTSWKLVYPDGQSAMTLPGQPEEAFTLRKYKEDLGKQYNRITLYLCPDEPEQLEIDNEADEECDSHDTR